MKRGILMTWCFLPLANCKTSGELCSGTAERAKDGNWYCSEVWAITYRNISQPGAYNRTTSIDPQTGLCSHERQSYPATGPLTPLFGEVLLPNCYVQDRVANRRTEVSMHIRGPMNVSQLAVYQLPGELHKMRKRNSVPFYNRRRALKQRTVSNSASAVATSSQTSTVHWLPLDKQRPCHTATRCTQSTVISTVTVTDCTTAATSVAAQNITYIGPPLPCLPTYTPWAISGEDAHAKSNCTCVQTHGAVSHYPLQPTSVDTSPAVLEMERTVKRDSPWAAAAAADWSRVAYYTSSAPAEATGISFLANRGDPRKSGTFD